MTTKKLVFILTLLVPLISFGQKVNFDTTHIKNEPFNDSFFVKRYALPPIGSSPYPIEIRLNVIEDSIGKCEARDLSFNGERWSAISIESLPNKSSDTTISPRKTRISYLFPKLPYDSIITKLNMIGVFNLPDQTTLPDQWFVNDGTVYSVAYKVGNKFRTFSFNNPEIYKTRYPKTKEYALYCELVELFFGQFGK